MTFFRHFRLAASPAFILAVMTVGCSPEEPTPSTPTPPAKAPGPADATPPDKKKDPVIDPEPSKKEDGDAGKTETKKDDGPQLKAPKTDDAPKAANVKLSDQEIALIKKLPAADQEIALAQAVCPVSGGHLGDEAMGPPVKVTAEGKTFFLCCNSCKDEVKANPKAVIAKLAK